MMTLKYIIAELANSGLSNYCISSLNPYDNDCTKYLITIGVGKHKKIEFVFDEEIKAITQFEITDRRL